MFPQLKSGDILHCRRSTFLSWMIQTLTKSRFSHSALFLIIEGQHFVVDAQKDGVNLRSFDAWMKKYNYQFIVSRCSCGTMNRVKHNAFQKIGVTAYDFKGLLIKSPIELIFGTWRKEKNAQSKMYCSEFVAWSYDILSSYRISPEELYQICLNSKSFKTFEL